MAVHIRLARAGTSKVPFTVLLQPTTGRPRGGRFIERLGTWDPRRKELVLNGVRIQHWLGVGAQPSAVVGQLLKRSAKSQAEAT